jgi:hypothetical protein
MYTYTASLPHTGVSAKLIQALCTREEHVEANERVHVLVRSECILQTPIITARIP